jgi:hypothetical protein
MLIQVYDGKTYRLMGKAGFHPEATEEQIDVAVRDQFACWSEEVFWTPYRETEPKRYVYWKKVE